MKEHELKQIWKKDEAIQPKVINSVLIEKRAIESQNRLRKRIKWDIAINILLFILAIPFFGENPKTLYSSPLITIIWAWYLWKTSRIYKFDNSFHKFENVKFFLLQKIIW